MTLSHARRLMIVLVLGASLLMPAGVSNAATFRIKADGRTWSPNFKHVEPGSKIVWKNPTTRRHTVTAWNGPWAKDVVLRPGTRTSKIFRNAGEYHYRCKRHSTVSNGECNGMCGLIHVAN